MALEKKLKKQVEGIAIEGELLNTVSYATYYCRQPLFNAFRLINGSEDTLENVTVTVSGSNALILQANVAVEELAPQTSIEVAVHNLLNPKYLSDLEKIEPCTVTVCVLVGKTVARSFTAEICALPMDYWSGLSGNVEMLSAFVRPKLSDCQKIKAEAGLQLKTWGYSSEWSGYAGNDKNSVRNAQASIYSAIRHLEVERALMPEQEDYACNVCTGDTSAIVANKQATPMEMALFVASCLESVKLNPVILLGKNKISVGVWLYDSCFSVPVQDDIALVQKYVSVGVNNIAAFDLDDLFTHKNASYTTSEHHLAQALAAEKFEVCIDVRRCRIGGVFPMPIKIKSGRSYELLGDEQISYEAKPKNIMDATKFSLDKKASKEDNWQRRLLDLSLKNNLLNFRMHRDCLHIRTADVSDFCAKLEQMQKFTLVSAAPSGEKVLPFGMTKQLGNFGELVSMEMNSGIIRAYCDEARLVETAALLQRKARTAQEEMGANTLCLAIGFLKWKHPEDKEVKYAPLCVVPVSIKRGKQNVTLSCGDECQINTTLLEFLKQEFGLDARGAADKGLTPAEVIALFRGKTAGMKGCEVYEDVYLAQFTFARYAMWRDVKENIGEYKKNALIASLLTNVNKLKSNALSGVNEDECSPAEVLAPLPCDSSQFSAIAESAKGTTFVLHGPPGTGKSQTIANIIANALDGGKRVLFVAEKQAALQVVKKRLADVGLGDFCMELHSGKADKSEIVQGIENTLALQSAYDNDAFVSLCERLTETRKSLLAPFTALHKKRRIGVSVYDAIIIYLQNKSAPELVDIESTFYDSLTRQKLEECESMILTAQIAARECGGVYRSPFDNINITDCSGGIADGIRCSAEVVLAELKHLKNYVGLFLDAFNQKLSTFTTKKLQNLIDIATMLQGGSLDVFFECEEEAFYQFYNANVRYDSEVKHWLQSFKCLPDLGRQGAQIEAELDNWGENYRSSKVLLNVLKRIQRCARAPIKERDELEWLKRAYEIDRAREAMFKNTVLCRNFLTLGYINDRKREEFLRPLYQLHALNAQTFMDYNADAFNSVCVRANRNKTLMPLIKGLLFAANAFIDSCDAFCAMTAADKSRFDDEDILEYYTAKCTALIDNIDMLPAWCLYKGTAKRLNENGLTFMTDAMENGRIGGEQIIASFRKNVYRNFIQTNIPADDSLSQFSAALLDENAATFSQQLDGFARLTKEKIRADLISRLPSQGTEGPLSIELTTFQRSVKGNMRGFHIRNLFTDVPELMKVVAPCMLMSPSTVSQYLPADSQMFDMVIFDEASQVPTAEAVPALARAQSAIIVGDPKQLPPTSFFVNMGQDEENMEAEDMESVLEDCLALGVPERHLNWHYRSKHESLIAFSNIMYYGSKLCTFPSPDAMDSKVKMHFVENGVYDRGNSKCNTVEAEALIAEVIRRLKDEKLSRSSMGIVTFSTPQQEYIVKHLNKAIYAAHLEAAAFEREEPLFVKNLENVQGDERDVILFSVCYGPDKYGKLSLNFGPLNQFGGWRRLNVAVSRAREEMLIFSSMHYSYIDLSRTTSRGVAGLKAFLEFAEKGRTNIAAKSDELILNKNGIGKYIAAELENYGYACRQNVGVSDFKIDVGVVDPNNKHNYVLAVLCDGSTRFSIKDRTVMQAQTLKRNNWNVIRIYAINFFNNPKREIKKIKEYLDRLTAKKGKATTAAFRKVYRTAKVEGHTVEAPYILSGENDAELMKTLKAIVTAEEPISQQFLIKRTLSVYGIQKYGVKLESKLRALTEKCAFEQKEMLGNVYYFRADKYSNYERYRVEESGQLRTADTDFTPFDVISLIKSILLNKVSLYCDELVAAVIKELKVPRVSDKITAFINACVDEGVYTGLLIRSISDKISLC